VKISRLKLIELIDVEVTRRERLADEELTRATARQSDERERYRVATQVAWRTFAQRIIERVNADEAVTSADVPRALTDGGRRTYGISLYHDIDEPRRANPRTADLRRLRELLQASLDEEISTYALEKQGFSLGRVL
jgi:hypothetical protein